jgi:hypothetical protein
MVVDDEIQRSSKGKNCLNEALIYGSSNVEKRLSFVFLVPV